VAAFPAYLRDQKNFFVICSDTMRPMVLAFVGSNRRRLFFHFHSPLHLLFKTLVFLLRPARRGASLDG
jgi:hypothetical protein